MVMSHRLRRRPRGHRGVESVNRAWEERVVSDLSASRDRPCNPAAAVLPAVSAAVEASAVEPGRTDSRTIQNEQLAPPATTLFNMNWMIAVPSGATMIPHTTP